MIYEKVYPDAQPIIFESKGSLKERGKEAMKVINVMEMKEIITEKQNSLKSDVNLYRNQEPMAAEVAQWGIELLEGIKNMISMKAFEATIYEYKTGRNGMK